MNKRQTAITIVIGVFGVGIIGTILGILVAGTALKNVQGTTQRPDTTIHPSTAESSNNSSGPGNSSSTTASSFKDGTYSASVNYIAHRHNESIQVTLKIKDNIISSSELEQSMSDRESQQYQTEFEQLYKSRVVGKKLDQVSISRIAGASDTSEAFMTAVRQIQNKAQS